MCGWSMRCLPARGGEARNESETSRSMKACALVDDYQISSIGRWPVDMADRMARATDE